MTIEKIILQFEPKKDNLLPVLKAIQREFGFVSIEAIESISRYFQQNPAAIYSTASFYDQIQTKKQLSVIVQVCDGTNCTTRKSDMIIKEIERFSGVRDGDEFNKNILIKREGCFGFCAQGPIVKVDGIVFEKVTPEIIDDILRPYIN